MNGMRWLGVVRHGESTGNVAREEAETDGVDVIDIPERDADVPLSPLGRDQAAAVGRWLADMPARHRPDVVISSPYLRARDTARIALDAAGLGARTPRLVFDERLRDRELGVLDLLTTHGVTARVPDEEARKRRLGKFYYRPPGGESWADMALRLRSLLGELDRDHAGGRALLFGHEAVVYLLRYIVEHLSEAEVLEIGRATLLANCSVTAWERGSGELRLVRFNDVDHLPRQGVPPTSDRRDRVHGA
jgi:2,3-bisphosphoglycerate-dependent phosphoglycerate mutase